MKILFTADLHLLQPRLDHTLSKIRGWLTGSQPDALVVAGDLSNAQQAGETLRMLRACFPNGPIAVCLGNHDFWVHDAARQKCVSLPEVIERFWAPAAKAFDVALLDDGNLLLPGVTIVGGYGHYDLGFAVPGLAYNGVAVTEEDYLRGWPPIGSAMRWSDFQFMPTRTDPREVAIDQVAGVRRRLVEVLDSQAIVVLHTPPFEVLLGVPPLSDKPMYAPPSVYKFFRAYLGNRAMGDLLREAWHNVAAVVCGHTHRPAGPVYLNGTATVGINIGSDYGLPRAALFRTESREFERLPD
jgi:Icc-related predicted phosphoesterase